VSSRTSSPEELLVHGGADPHGAGFRGDIFGVSGVGSASRSASRLTRYFGFTSAAIWAASILPARLPER
jgi:hypothetical protein